ncbi:MAG TPA: phosphoenolpyruvate--protein phosphotransferase [Terriglobales bacterium]|jgi:phosphocarrier protein FPr
MVGLVLVSHSKKLAEAVRELVLQMTAPGFPIAIAGGVGDNYDDLGTDAVHISEVLQELPCPEGVLVLMDLGSAVLSAETALELFDSATRPIRLCPAALVEGAVAAAVRAQAGGTIDEVAQEAELGLAAKREQLGVESATELPSVAAQSLTGKPEETAELVLEVRNQHGLHARPAAALIQTASRFSSVVEIANLSASRGPASARSLTSLSLLNVRQGDRIKVVCSGKDCQAALQAIRDLASADFGDKAETEPLLKPATPKPSAEVRGFPGSDGIAIGPLIALQQLEISVDDTAPGEPAAELAALTGAMDSAREQLERAKSQTGANAILEAQALILSDPAVLKKLQSAVKNEKLSAARAWAVITRELAAEYEAMDDTYLRERAADIRDIAQRVLRQMKGIDSHPPICPDTPAILFTGELLPSEASVCDPKQVLGVITAKGSATSHSAILMRTLGIPMVVGAVGIGQADAGKTIAMDGSTGEFWINPDAAIRARLSGLRQLQLDRKRQAERARTEPSITLDGHRIEILANVGNVRDSQVAAENGAEGVGLLRTEFLFLSRHEAPTEDEQVRILREICQPISGPIILRTLDVGADKPLAFLPQAEEHNPYLGVRGIRLSLRSPELFLSHLRAILRAGAGHEIWLMFPMIALQREARQALDLLDEAHRQLQTANTPHAWPIKRGIMIEVPSAALLAEQLAEDLDFFSIGTNDLTQYTMAAERGNANVADLQDALHPAVLRLMKSVVKGAAARHRHVSVCGDAASDPLAAAIFAGLGIRSLSVRPNQCAEIKALFRELDMTRLQQIASQSLLQHDAHEVRNLVAEHLHTAAPAK